MSNLLRKDLIIKKLKYTLLAILFLFLFTSTSYADGWTKVGNEWKYIKNGEYETNKILDLADGLYFINEYGSMAENRWIEFTETSKMYAGSDGKLYRGGVYKVENVPYYFNHSGFLEYGWIDDIYYADEFGVLCTGFKEVKILDYWKDADNVLSTAWFYFSPDTYKKTYATNSDYVTKLIDGKRYSFNEHGIMSVGWCKVKDAIPEIAGYMYFNTLPSSKFAFGEAVTNTWYAVEAPKFSSANGDVSWFYFSGNGYPKCGEQGRYTKTLINGKYYLFNQYGNPVYGIREVDGEYYYFGNNINNCSMKTGAVSVEIEGNEAISYFFTTSGYGLTGVKDGKLYYKGRLQTADQTLRIEAFHVNNNDYLVNTSGVILKNKSKMKDIDGNEWTTNASGIVISYSEDATISENLLPEVDLD